MTAILVAASPAQAQPSERFPDHTTIVVSGVRYEGFDLGGFTELLRMDADLSYYEQAYANVTAQLLLATAEVANLQRALVARDAEVATLQAERARLLGMWTEENRLRLECENSPDIFGWMGWGLAGAFGVATLVLSLVTGAAL